MILPFKLETDILSNISNTRKNVSSAIQTLRKRVEKTRRGRVCFNQ